MLRLQCGVLAVKLVVAGALVASIVAACASNPHSPPEAPAPASVMPGVSPEHAQIQQLWDQIDQIDRQRGSLPPSGPHAMPMAAGSAACKRDPSETCTQTCQLSDSICDNAKKICDIAQTLRDDDWAAKKCADANATCDAAAKQCCECASS